MNRKFYRWLEKWAGDRLAKDEARHNWAGMKNEFHKTREEIHTAWSHNGDRIVSRLIDQINPRMSDINVVMKETLTEVIGRKVDEGSVSVKAFIDRGNSLLASCTGRIFVTLSGLETKVNDWFEQLNRGSEELSRQASVHDANNYERYTQMGDEIRRLRLKVDEHQSLNYKTLLALHNDTVARIEGLKSKDKEHFSSSPTKEWLFDNIDEIIEMADIAKAVRDNAAPRENTIYKLVSAIRRLELYGASDVRDEIISKINTWDNDQSNVHRLHA